MNKLLPILLAVVLSGCAASQTTVNKPYITEYTSNAEEILGECVNLDCKLADEICGKKNENGNRKLDDDTCRMNIARHNMQTGKTSVIKPPSKDPCLEMDCSLTSELASKICIDRSDFDNPKTMNESQCKMMIKRFQMRVMNGESHEDASNFRVQESYDYTIPYVDEERERRDFESYKYKTEPYGKKENERGYAWKKCMTALMNDTVGRTLRGIDAANLCDRKTR